MPSVSDKQKRFMRIAAHSPEFAELVGIEPDVAKEYYQEDKKEEDEGDESETKSTG